MWIEPELGREARCGLRGVPKHFRGIARFIGPLCGQWPWGEYDGTPHRVDSPELILQARRVA